MTPWLLALVALATLTPPGREPPRWCTYDTWTWSVTERRAVDARHVRKPYSGLSGDEKAPDWATSGCTVCREDQEEVRVAGLPPVHVCRGVAARVRAALEEVGASGFRVEALVGYRVGRSGGPVSAGKRTRYGWHAYGLALDVNPGANGLYTGCARESKAPAAARDLAGCRLSIGGAWDPGERPHETLTSTGPVVRAFARHLGWRWGGERDDGLKDLMHLSPDGD